MVARIRYNIRVTERTEIEVDPEEISMCARVITTVGKPKLLGKNDLRDAIIQQSGVRKYLKRNKLKVEL